uniref:Uncharacterized protein n=1 Tax=Lepeophtheirus salmonis TaxID=72036 RepID=A0A0K2U1Z1_LEPSM
MVLLSIYIVNLLRIFYFKICFSTLTIPRLYIKGVRKGWARGSFSTQSK